ncbi:MAG: hypothetical protein ACK6EB_33365 [Planctomyces sp.]
MSSGRFIMRGWSSQGYRAAGRALANGGAGPIPVEELTTRLAIVGVSRQRLAIDGTSSERLTARGVSGQRLALTGASE